MAAVMAIDSLSSDIPYDRERRKICNKLLSIISNHFHFR
jgi:hypothetical protein